MLWFQKAEEVPPVWQEAQSLSSTLLAASTLGSRWVEFAVNAWRSLLPRPEPGQEWSAALQEYVQDAAAPLGLTPQGLGTLWQRSSQETQELVRPWTETALATPELLNQSLVSGGEAPTLVPLASRYCKAYEQTFERLLSQPRTLMPAEVEEQLPQRLATWLELRKAFLDYQSVLADGGYRIIQGFTVELVRRVDPKDGPPTLREMVQAWSSVADRELTSVVISEPYLRAQRQLLAASLRYRMREQEVLVSYQRLRTAPTRSEMDEVQRTVADLRQEVNELKQALRELQRQKS